MDKLTAIKNLLTEMSMRGTVRWTIGAMNKQGQLTWFTESTKPDCIYGNIEEIFQKLEKCVETGQSL